MSSDFLILYYTIMANITTHVSNREQVTIMLRWVDNRDFSVHEEYICLYAVPSQDSSLYVLVSIIKDIGWA